LVVAQATRIVMYRPARRLFSVTATAWQLGIGSAIEIVWAILLMSGGWRTTSGANQWMFWFVPIPILTLGWVRLYQRVAKR
jgi:hypothetical protein